MDRILSWKIDSSTYAYIYPIKNSYISNRIPENSPLWGEIINEISAWTKDTYYANFKKMALEVKSKYGQDIPWQDEYWDFSDDNTNLPVNIVLLAGQDGGGSGTGSNGTGGGDGIEVYEELRDAINKELEKAKKDIEEQNKRVEEFVVQKVGETIAEAKNTIAKTKEELADVREELENKLEGAADALDKAAALFDMGEGGITGEKIQEAISSVNECGEWITEYSGTVNDFKTDYDAAKRILGGVGSAEDASAGLFSQIGTTINDMDNTVGNVESWIVASAATIGDIATWYDVNASSVTEASSIINASAGTITDAINFISGDGLTTRITKEMNALSGSIRDVIMLETSSAVTNVKNELNAISGIVETSVNRLNTIDGELTSLGSRMNTEEHKMEQWMNISESAMSLSHDLRDTWSVESGKLSTVANLTAQTDEDGNIIYYVSAGTGAETIVFHNGVNWVDEYGRTYAEEMVYVHWSQALGSYIQQEASSVTMSVMNSSGLTAAIKLAIDRGEKGEEESIIEMVSDKLVITGEMIAQAISANTANIGGIHMGMGQIWSEAINGDESPKFRLNGVNGTLYASDAEISGTIYATDGWFKGSVSADSGYFRGSLEADSGKIGGFVIEDETLAVSGLSGYTAVLKGDATSQENKDLFQLGLDLSERKVLYAYKASGSTMSDTSNKIVSSVTKYSRIYLTQEQISEGEEVDAYYLNNHLTGSNLVIGVQYDKLFSFDSAGTVVNINPGANWWGSQHKFVKNAVKVKVPIPANGFGIGSSTAIRYEYYVRDATGNNDLTCSACSKYEFPIYNTRITSNGIIYCETLNAKEGMYCGTINSDGYFCGELDCNKGALNNVSLRNTEFYGNIIMNSGSSFSSVDGKYSERYFTILPYSVDDIAVKTYPNVEYYRYIKNSNGNNAGKVYYVGNNSGDSVSLVDIVVSSGDTIIIPKINLNIWRYIPDTRVGKSISLSLKYTLGSESDTLYTFDLPDFQLHGSETYTGTTLTQSLTATSNTRLTIFLSYNIHLPTYYWFGADKAAASIDISNTGSIKVTPSGAITDGVVIGTDGFMVKSGNYGLKITEYGGMKKWKNSSWVDL